MSISEREALAIAYSRKCERRRARASHAASNLLKRLVCFAAGMWAVVLLVLVNV